MNMGEHTLFLCKYVDINFSRIPYFTTKSVGSGQILDNGWKTKVEIGFTK